MRDLRRALGYFTILPGGVAEPPTGSAVAWLPVVGALVGALAGAFGELVAVRSVPLGAATAVASSIVLTGAIHLDGFADSCDALFAGVPVARRLEILKDPRNGTFALAGVLAAGAVWLAAAQSIPAVEYPLAFALAAASARLGAIVHMPYARHARADAAPPAFTQAQPPLVVAIGCALVAASIVVAHIEHGAGFALSLGLAALVAFACATIAVGWARTRLDGAVVGDTFGFAIVLAEVGALAAVALTMPHAAVPPARSGT